MVTENESEFSCVFNNTSSGYGKEMDTWVKEDTMEQNERKKRMKFVK